MYCPVVKMTTVTAVTRLRADKRSGLISADDGCIRTLAEEGYVRQVKPFADGFVMGLELPALRSAQSPLAALILASNFKKPMEANEPHR